MNDQVKNIQSMINLTIDGVAISVPKGTTLYQAAKKLGVKIPIFCYHDRMPPFGACRVCLVEVEKMGKLQPSCCVEAAEGMVVKTQSEMAVEGRKSILELLLINHPLDCPVCDRGGECPLQDQALSDGPGESRFFEDKRRFKKPIPLGPVLMLDRERCIICARCTRFGESIAGDNALEFQERGYKTEVGTPNQEPVDSKFIGNTIMICPVGALTSQVYRFRARPWDNKQAITTCTLCPVGCSKIIDSRDGEIVRTRSQENPEVNDTWLCDKGWFGYEFVSNIQRLKNPLIRRNGILEEATYEEAFDLIAKKLNEAKLNKKIASLGGNTLTVEENYLFQKLTREVFGVNNLDHRVGESIIPFESEGIQPGMEISIGDCESLSHALLLGFDVTEEFPVIWLRLKQAINKGAKVGFIGHFKPEIARHLSNVVVHQPGHEIEVIKYIIAETEKMDLKKDRGAIFIGSQYLNSPDRQAILTLLLEFQKRTEGISLNVMEGRGNSLGARFAGMRPDILPGGWINNESGLNAMEIMEHASEEGWDFLYIAGVNSSLKLPSWLWKKAREKIGFLVVQDLFLNETAYEADVVLPTVSYLEKWGNFINIEGRIQKLRPGKEIPEAIYADGDLFVMLARKLGFELELDKDFSAKLKLSKINFQRNESSKCDKELNKATLSENGLYATFTYTLFDQGVRMKHNLHLSRVVKEPFVRIHSVEAAKRGIYDGEVCVLQVDENKINAKIKIDDGVALNTVVLPLGFTSLPVNELNVRLFNGLEIIMHKSLNKGSEQK